MQIYDPSCVLAPQVAPSATDAVWIYSISYGGGIVSVRLYLFILFFKDLAFIGTSFMVFDFQGDRVSCGLSVADDCTVALTTQASTKVLSLAN